MFPRTTLASVTALIVLTGCATGASSSVETDVSHREVCENADAPMGLKAELDEWFSTEPHHLDTVIVSQSGQQLYACGFGEFAPDRLHEIQSATKTFTSMLIGAAIQDGLIASLDQPLSELLPDHASLFEGDRANITLRHVLTMTTGLNWVDFGAGNSFQRIERAKDGVAFILSEPMVSEPGETFFYNTGSSHLLSAVITQQTGLPAAEYARIKLFEPMGISDVRWPALQDGVNKGGWDMYMRPDDMLKFGQMILNGGRVGDLQLVPEAYIDEATQKHTDTYYGTGYGFQMWIPNTIGTVDAAAARGYGGQDIFVLQDLNTVVVFTGDIMFPRENNDDIERLLRDIIVPSLKGN